MRRSHPEEEKQGPAKESGKKRDSKKAALQRGSTQPTGKNSVFKGDGRSGQFNKDVNSD